VREIKQKREDIQQNFCPQPPPKPPRPHTPIEMYVYLYEKQANWKLKFEEWCLLGCNHVWL
jgi:hypothetical protein